jgi:hypothetical protein
MNSNSFKKPNLLDLLPKPKGGKTKNKKSELSSLTFLPKLGPIQTSKKV